MCLVLCKVANVEYLRHPKITLWGGYNYLHKSNQRSKDPNKEVPVWFPSHTVGCSVESMFFWLSFPFVSPLCKRAEDTSCKLTEMTTSSSAHIQALCTSRPLQQANTSHAPSHSAALPAPFPLILLIPEPLRPRVTRERDVALPAEKEKGLFLFIWQKPLQPKPLQKS